MIGSTPEPDDGFTGLDGDVGRAGSDEPGADDAALMAELDDLLRDGAEPPAEVLEAARQIYAWRTVDAELAALTFDSVLDAEPAPSRAGDRTPGLQTRSLTFRSVGLTIDLEVDVGPHGRRLLGQLDPPQTARIELRGEGEVVTSTADGIGRFALPLRSVIERIVVRCRLSDGTEVVSASAMV